jgi:hypothetical protein
MYRRSSGRIYQLLQSQIAEAAAQSTQSGAAAAAAGISRTAAADAAQHLHGQPACSAWLQQLGSRSFQTWSSRAAPMGLGSGLGRQQQQQQRVSGPHTLLCVRMRTPTACMRYTLAADRSLTLCCLVRVCAQAVAGAASRHLQTRTVCRVKATQ